MSDNIFLDYIEKLRHLQKHNAFASQGTAMFSEMKQQKRTDLQIIFNEPFRAYKRPEWMFPIAWRSAPD